MTDSKGEITNKKFAKENSTFHKAIDQVNSRLGLNLTPTRRQASKFRRRRGIAYTFGILGKLPKGWEVRNGR